MPGQDAGDEDDAPLDSAELAASPSDDELDTWLRQMARPRRAAQPFAPGLVLDGRYRVLERVGAGGMGWVYRGQRLGDGFRVAIKQLRFDAEPEGAIRFAREALAPSAVRSEHVVHVLDRGVVEGYGPYLVMEYLHGQTLAEAIERDAPFALLRAVDIGVQLCSVLAAVHATGTVHRDVKPANVLLVERADRADFVKLVDFGVAKLARSPDDNPTLLTRSGVLLGTPAYMAPEQVRTPHDVDLRADVYAVGAVLFEMLAGCRVHAALDPYASTLRYEVEDAARQVLGERTTPAVVLPPAMAAVVTRALHPERARRYPDCTALAVALSAVVDASTPAR